MSLEYGLLYRSHDKGLLVIKRLGEGKYDEKEEDRQIRRKLHSDYSTFRGVLVIVGGDLRSYQVGATIEEKLIW